MSMSKVLIVDDFKTQQAFLKNLLAEINIDFETASSGIEALEILNRQDISLVLTDNEMPKMNGFELLKAIKADVSLKHIPVIMISSNDSIKNDALKEGLFEFVLKPFDKHTLNSVIHKALGNSMFNSSYRVLLLDDVSIQTEVWAKVLEMPSFIYDKANTAQDALNFLRTHTYDAILTDYLMPNVDGERFVKKIKSITEFQHIPIFMITSHKEMQKTGLTGVENVFLKPFNSAEVKTALKLAVGWNN